MVSVSPQTIARFCAQESTKAVAFSLRLAKVVAFATPNNGVSNSVNVTLENTAYFFNCTNASGSNSQRIMAKNCSACARYKRNSALILPFGSQWLVNVCSPMVSFVTSAVSCPCRYFSASAPAISIRRYWFSRTQKSGWSLVICWHSHFIKHSLL